MASNCASVSPQKPTMTSVVRLMPGHGGAQAADELEVAATLVLAAHASQHLVVARLDRQVEVLADRGALGHGRDEPVGEVPGVRGHEAQARDARPPLTVAQPVDGAQERGDVGSTVAGLAASQRGAGRRHRRSAARGQVVAPGVDVLAEQRRPPRQPAAASDGGLGEDVVEGSAALRPAREGHDAVGARLVAAVDDGQPGARTPSRARRGPPPRPPARVRGQAVGRRGHGLRPTRWRTGAPSDPARRDVRSPGGVRPQSGPSARAPRPAAGRGPRPGSAAAGRPRCRPAPSSR